MRPTPHSPHASRSTTTSRLTRRAVVLGSAASLGLATACSGSSGGIGSAGTTSLRFDWWGSDTRHALTQQAIDLFEAAHTDIQVQPEYSNFSDYFDKLATGAASGDLPDVMQMVDPNMYSYIDNGQLLDLHGLSDFLPTDGFDETSLAGTTVDGGLYGIPAGISGFGIFADPQVFQEAGVPLPDDGSWTWDEYLQTAAAITSALPDVSGTQLPLDEQMLTVWMRQHGEDWWSEDASDIAFTATTAADFWTWVLALRDSGGTLSPEAAVEAASSGTGIERGPLALHTGAMQIAAVNQLGGLEEVSGRETKIMLFPGERTAAHTGIYTKPGQYYSVAANSENPEEAARLIDFLANSPEAGKLLKFDRGVTPNTDVLAELQPDLTPVETRIADYFERIASLDPTPFPKANVNAAPAMPELVARLTQDVLFDRKTPVEAGGQLVSDLSSQL